MGGKTWTYEQEMQLKRMAPNHYASDIAKAIGRTTPSVFAKAYEMGIYLNAFDGKKKWNDDMDNLLLSKPLKEAAEELGVTHRQAMLRRQYIRRKMMRDRELQPSDNLENPVIHRIVKATEVPPLVVRGPRSIFDLAMAA
jgi:hypothetical protein